MTAFKRRQAKCVKVNIRPRTGPRNPAWLRQHLMAWISEDELSGKALPKPGRRKLYPFKRPGYANTWRGIHVKPRDETAADVDGFGRHMRHASAA
jgi:hypothetical protein